MDSTIIYTVVLLLVITVYYNYWVKPQRIIKNYAK